MVKYECAALTHTAMLALESSDKMENDMTDHVHENFGRREQYDDFHFWLARIRLVSGAKGTHHTRSPQKLHSIRMN